MKTPAPEPHPTQDILRHPREHDGLTQRELSGQAGVMEPTTFAALKAMKQRGYVTRRLLLAVIENLAREEAGPENPARRPRP